MHGDENKKRQGAIMKVKIEIDEQLTEEEVLIKCPVLNERVNRIYQEMAELEKREKNLVLYKDNTEYYIPLQKVLFFETDGGCISAHTANDIYQIHIRLYELEESLPGNFMRVSKSTILYTKSVYSVTKNLTASSVVQLLNTHKQVFVSRNYYKALKSRLEDKRMGI